MAYNFGLNEKGGSLSKSVWLVVGVLGGRLGSKPPLLVFPAIPRGEFQPFPGLKSNPFLCILMA